MILPPAPLAAVGPDGEAGRRRYRLDGGVASYDFSNGLLGRRSAWRWISAHGRDIGFNLQAGYFGDAENALWMDGALMPLGPLDVTVEPDGAVRVAACGHGAGGAGRGLPRTLVAGEWPQRGAFPQVDRQLSAALAEFDQDQTRGGGDPYTTSSFRLKRRKKIRPACPKTNVSSMP